MKKFLKVPEAAEALNLSQKTIWKMVAHRELDVVRFGRAVRIPEAALQQLIERGTMPARAS